MPSDKLKSEVNIEIWDFNSSKLGRINIFRIPELFYRIYKKLKMKNYDLVISSTQHCLHSKIVYMLRKIFHYNLAFVSEVWRYEHTKDILQLLWREAAKFILVNCDFVFCEGSKSLNFARNLGVKGKNSFIFPLMCEDLSKKKMITSYSLENKFHRYKDSIKIGYIGRFIEQKGLRYLIESFKNVSKHYDNAALFLIGGGELKSTLEEMANDTDKISLIDWVEPHYLPFIYSQLDLFVLPSYYDGWSTVVSEAASMGLPLIVTDMVGCAPDLVENGKNGYVVCVKNASQLEDAILKTIKRGKDGMKRMGALSRQKYERLNDYGNHEDVINRVMSDIDGKR